MPIIVSDEQLMALEVEEQLAKITELCSGAHAPKTVALVVDIMNILWAPVLSRIIRNELEGQREARNVLELLRFVDSVRSAEPNVHLGLARRLAGNDAAPACANNLDNLYNGSHDFATVAVVIEVYMCKMNQVLEGMPLPEDTIERNEFMVRLLRLKGYPFRMPDYLAKEAASRA